jgi:hypothetical protein
VQSCQPLLLACHDFVLLVLAGFPPKCAEALTKLRQQLQQEALQDTDDAKLSQAGNTNYTVSSLSGFSSCALP